MKVKYTDTDTDTVNSRISVISGIPFSALLRGFALIWEFLHGEKFENLLS